MFWSSFIGGLIGGLGIVFFTVIFNMRGNEQERIELEYQNRKNSKKQRRK